MLAIDKFPVPMNKKELSRGYYGGFCKHFSTIVAPQTSHFSPKVTGEVTGEVKGEWKMAARADAAARSSRVHVLLIY